nr:hypothetical protein [Tanacetum cinerariifolium]
DSVAAKHSRDDAPIKGRSINEGEAAVEKISNDSEEVARVLTSMDVATVLAGGIDVPTGSGSIPTAGLPAADISTGSEVAPTASPIITASLIVSSYSRRKGKEVMVESNTLKKQKLQEQIYAQIQQRRPMTKKQKREYYMAMIKNNLGWKVKDFKGLSFEEIEAKFAKVWKQVEDFIPMGSKEEAERLKSKGFNLEQEHLVPVEDVYVQALQVKHPIIDWKVHTEGQRSYWKIIRLGGSSACYQFVIDLLKQLDREDLNQLWALVKEYLSIRPATSEKKMELWVELKRLYKPDPEDQLWILTYNFMHAPVEWKLYDLSKVHHLTTKDKEIFMLVEKDYPLKKGLALVMISYKLQRRIVGNKMHKEFSLLVRMFPLPEGTSHCLKMNATVRRIEMPLLEVCTAIEEKKNKLPVKDR